MMLSVRLVGRLVDKEGGELGVVGMGGFVIQYTTYRK